MEREALAQLKLHFRELQISAETQRERADVVRVETDHIVRRTQALLEQSRRTLRRLRGLLND